MVRKSNIRTYTPPEKVKVEPNIAVVKDLLADNIDGHVIYFCDEAARIARPDAKKHRPCRWETTPMGSQESLLRLRGAGLSEEQD